MSRSLNHQKCIAVAGYGVWRWRLMAQGDPQTEQLLLNFLSNAVRWLTGPDENRFVRVTAGKSSYSEGERVDFIGQVYNQSAQPVDDAHLQLNVRHEGKARTAELMPVGDGRYEGSLEGLGEGDYAFEAAATLNGTSLGADSGRFSMGGVNLEFLDTRMHAGLLRRLATETGGRFLSPSEVDKLDSLLAGEPWLKAESVVQKSDVELWNWPYLLAAVILLLAGEWLIRKRTGMI